jgi:hypothetical protein
MAGRSDYEDVERKLTPELVDAILDGETPTGNPAAERLAAILADLRSELLIHPVDDVAHRHLDSMAAAMASGDDAVAFERKLGDAETPASQFELTRNVPATLERKGSTELASAGNITRLERKTSRGLPARRRLVGAAAAATVLLTGGLAAAGELPAPAQAAVSKVVSFVGIHVPDGQDHADNHGSDVSGAAHDPGVTGCEKGAAVSTTASSNASDHRASDGNGHSCGVNGNGAGSSGEDNGSGHGNAGGHGHGNAGAHGQGNADGTGNGYGQGGNRAHGAGSGKSGEQGSSGGGSSAGEGTGNAGGSGGHQGQGGGPNGSNAGSSGGHQGQGDGTTGGNTGSGGHQGGGSGGTGGSGGSDSGGGGSGDGSGSAGSTGGGGSSGNSDKGESLGGTAQDPSGTDNGNSALT